MPERHEMPDPAATGATTGVVSDAVRGNWVDHLAPAATRPYLRLSRADRPIGTWLLLIPCWWGLALAAAGSAAGPGWYDLWIAAGCAIGAFVMRGAGCTWNDITDREFDARVARTRSRPLPSGQVTVRQALIWMVVQCLIGAAVLITFPLPAIVAGVASLAAVAVYPFAKRFTWWPQVFLGVAFNWGIFVGWAAHTGSIGAAPVVMWLAGIAWTLFYDTIYAHQDKEDDVLIGVKSTARLFGDAATPAWLGGFMALTLALLGLAVVLALPAGLAMWLALAGVAAFGGHLAWQLARLDTRDPIRCMMLFRANRDAGLILALFLAGAAMV